MSATATAPRHFQMHVRIAVADFDNWRTQVPALIESFERYLRHAGMRAVAPLSIYGLTPDVHPEIHGLFRVLCAYEPFPIVGTEDEPNEDGDPVYIYGGPCYLLRADCFTEAA